MKNLLIIGARGYGREIYGLALSSIGYNENFIVKGFLDSKQDALSGYKNYPPIISSVENYTAQKNDVFICALGSVYYKKYYIELLLKKNPSAKFITLCHKNASISFNTKIGNGCIICNNVIISCDVTIEDFVTIQPFSGIGHDAYIGKLCHLNTYSFMGGDSRLENEACIETNGILLPHKVLGKGATLGAGSVAIRNIQDQITVFGVPAKKIDF